MGSTPKPFPQKQAHGKRMRSTLRAQTAGICRTAQTLSSTDISRPACRRRVSEPLRRGDQPRPCPVLVCRPPPCNENPGCASISPHSCFFGRHAFQTSFSRVTRCPFIRVTHMMSGPFSVLLPRCTQSQASFPSWQYNAAAPFSGKSASPAACLKRRPWLRC